MKMMFKGNSTRLEMVIEKIHSNKETVITINNKKPGKLRSNQFSKSFLRKTETTFPL